MSADSLPDARLAALHDSYVWEVNEAIAEGRDDLVRRLPDAYLDDALRYLAEDAGPGCGRPDCPVCAARRTDRRPAAPRRAGWWPLRRRPR